MAKLAKGKQMQRQILPFAVVSGIPVLLLVLGVTIGALWLWTALIYLTIVIFALDSFDGEPDPAQAENGADTLSVFLAVAHFGLMALAVWAISGGLDGSERVLAFFAFGLFFGQVSNSNAHELIHRPNKALHWLGAWVFISHLFGHHSSAHPHVHHRLVATREDPNTARWGQSFYRYAPIAWRGSFMQGLKAERARRKRSNPYVVYIGGAVLMVFIAWTIAGINGIAAYLALAIYATTQILLSDYVQHYGLSRRIGADGRAEPVGPQHSWDSPHRFSSLLMLNAPRHSDHHAHPARAYPALELPSGGPVLPYSLPVMGLIAWSPKLWRRLMDTRLAEYEANTLQEKI